jgi:hypothetical protein
MYLHIQMNNPFYFLQVCSHRSISTFFIFSLELTLEEELIEEEKLLI